MKIKILGVENSRRLELETNIRSTLKKLELPAKIQVVDLLDDILKHDITGIPAVIVNEKVMFQNGVPDKQKILNYFQKIAQQNASTLGMMK